MNARTSYILHGISLVGILVLLILHFSPSGSGSAATGAQASPASSNGALRIAYVVEDSLYAQYGFYKATQEELEAKALTIQQRVTGRQRALQNKAAQMEQQYNAGQMTAAQAQQAQLSLQQEAQQFEAFQNQQAQAMQEAQAEANESLRKRILAYLDERQKEWGYDYILFKRESRSDILWASEAYDITETVVSELNERYKQERALSGEGDSDDTDDSDDTEATGNE